MKKFLLPLLMVFTIAALLMGTAPANANMVMYLDDTSTGGIDIIIVDNVDGGVGTPTGIGLSNTADLSATGGKILYDGTFGTWTVSVTSTGLSKDNIGSASEPHMDLNSVMVSGANPGVLLIGLTDTDFVVPGQELGLSLVNEWGGTAGGTVRAQGQLGAGNGEFQVTFFTPIQGPFGPGAFSDTTSVAIVAGALGAGNPFSLTEIVEITHTGANQVTSFDKEITVVPEPGTMLLIGTGLLGLAGLGRRKLRKK